MQACARLAALICCWLLWPLAVLAEPQLPNLSGRVVDAAGLLSPQQETSLSERLAAEEAKSSNQIVVVTLPDLQGYDIADFGLALGRQWGIGQAGKDNGALLIVAPSERKVRIEVGYGLEGNLTDALSSHIIRREILPAFRNNDYPGGIDNGITAMLGAIDGSYTPDLNEDKFEGALIPLAFVVFFGASQLLRRVVGSRHTGHLLFSGMLGFIVSMATQVIFYGIGAGIVAFALLSLLGNKGGGSGGSGRTRQPGMLGHGGFGGGIGRSGGFSGGGGGFGGGGASGGW